jgi:hypothetical protein
MRKLIAMAGLGLVLMGSSAALAQESVRHYRGQGYYQGNQFLYNEHNAVNGNGFYEGMGLPWRGG